jgi:hypothetical protein
MPLPSINCRKSELSADYPAEGFNILRYIPQKVIIFCALFLVSFLSLKNITAKTKNKIENIFRRSSGANEVSIYEKTEPKISCYSPFKAGPKSHLKWL